MWPLGSLVYSFVSMQWNCFRLIVCHQLTISNQGLCINLHVPNLSAVFVFVLIYIYFFSVMILHASKTKLSFYHEKADRIIN